jgi:hypothetical protein
MEIVNITELFPLLLSFLNTYIQYTYIFLYFVFFVGPHELIVRIHLNIFLLGKKKNNIKEYDFSIMRFF